MHREVGWASPKGPTRREKKRKRGERVGRGVGEPPAEGGGKEGRGGDGWKRLRYN